MATTMKALEAASTQVGATDTTLYTVPGSTTTRIASLTLANDSETTSCWVKVHKCKSGDGVGDDTILLPKTSIPPKCVINVIDHVGDQLMEAAGFLSAIAETAAQITVHISGYEVS